MSKEKLEELVSEMDRMLSVDPSPQFAARVRSRIDSARRGPAFLRWAAAAFAVVLAAITANLAIDRRLDVPPPPEAQKASPTPTPSFQRTAAPTRPRQRERRTFEVLVPPGQGEAILRFHARLLRGEASPLFATPFDPDASLPEPESIVIPPLELGELGNP